MANVLSETFWPGFRVVGSACSRVDRLLFSGLDRRLALKRREKLLADASVSLSPVRRLHGGTIRPDDQAKFPPPFDYAYAVLQFEEFLVRVIRGRDELRAQVAPGFASTEWEELAVILLAARPPIRGIPSVQIDSLSELNDILLSSWDELTSALSPARYAATRQTLRRLYEMPLEYQWKIRSGQVRTPPNSP